MTTIDIDFYVSANYVYFFFTLLSQLRRNGNDQNSSQKRVIFPPSKPKMQLKQIISSCNFFAYFCILFCSKGDYANRCARACMHFERCTLASLQQKVERRHISLFPGQHLTFISEDSSTTRHLELDPRIICTVRFIEPISVRDPQSRVTKKGHQIKIRQQCQKPRDQELATEK